MPTECSATLFEFAPVDGRQVVTALRRRRDHLHAGALLLSETDRAIRLTGGLPRASPTRARRNWWSTKSSTMVLQRVVGIALGYEDLNDHDVLRHDPVLSVLAGKLAAKRSDCAPLAGKSTLNRLELSRPEAARLPQDQP